MRETPAIIAGHSHTVCLGVPMVSEDGLAKHVDLLGGNRLFQGVTGAYPRDQAYWDLLTQVGAGRKVALFWDGNQHLASYLFASPPLFDFHLANFPELPVERQVHVVPETAIRARFAPSFAYLHHVVDYLRMTNCQPVLCGTPPPKGNDARLRKLIANEWHFIRAAQDLHISLQEVEMSPPRLRLKLWLVLQETLEDVGRTHSIPFVQVPASVQTSDGFLIEEYWAEDATHANEAYGKVMLDHLAAELNLLAKFS